MQGAENVQDAKVLGACDFGFRSITSLAILYLALCMTDKRIRNN
jgi:hypothetical protein